MAEQLPPESASQMRGPEMQPEKKLFIERFRKAKEKIPNQEHLLQKIYFAIKNKTDLQFTPDFSELYFEHPVKLVDIHILPEIEKLPSVLQLQAIEDDINSYKQMITNLQLEIEASKKENWKLRSKVEKLRSHTASVDRKIIEEANRAIKQNYERQIVEIGEELLGTKAKLNELEQLNSEQERVIFKLKKENEIMQNKLVDQMMQNEKAKREADSRTQHTENSNKHRSSSTALGEPPEQLLDAVHTLSRILSARIEENGNGKPKDLLKEFDDIPDLSSLTPPPPPIVDNWENFEKASLQTPVTAPISSEPKNSYTEIISAIKNIKPNSEARLSAISNAIQKREKLKAPSFSEKLNSDFLQRKMELNHTGGIEKVERERKRRDEETRKALIAILKDNALPIQHSEKNSISMLIETFFGGNATNSIT